MGTSYNDLREGTGFIIILAYAAFVIISVMGCLVWAVSLLRESSLREAPRLLAALRALRAPNRAVFCFRFFSLLFFLQGRPGGHKEKQIERL
jgi:hypothetical protein